MYQRKVKADCAKQQFCISFLPTEEWLEHNGTTEIMRHPAADGDDGRNLGVAQPFGAWIYCGHVRHGQDEWYQYGFMTLQIRIWYTGYT